MNIERVRIPFGADFDLKSLLTKLEI